jgi:endonuclease YncB( thermonuclease family)
MKTGRATFVVALLLSSLIHDFTLHAEELVPWTEKPVHVDRSKQNFERLPPLQPPSDPRQWIVVPARIDVIDGVTFAFSNKTYRLAGLKSVERKRMCKMAEGGRWACGRMAAIFLGNLVRGKRLLCEITERPDAVVLANCQVPGKVISEAVLKAGYAWSLADNGGSPAEAFAKDNGVGFWRNPACKDRPDAC